MKSAMEGLPAVSHLFALMADSVSAMINDHLPGFTDSYVVVNLISHHVPPTSETH